MQKSNATLFVNTLSRRNGCLFSWRYTLPKDTRSCSVSICRTSRAEENTSTVDNLFVTLLRAVKVLIEQRFDEIDKDALVQDICRREMIWNAREKYSVDIHIFVYVRTYIDIIRCDWIANRDASWWMRICGTFSDAEHTMQENGSIIRRRNIIYENSFRREPRIHTLPISMKWSEIVQNPTLFPVRGITSVRIRRGPWLPSLHGSLLITCLSLSLSLPLSPSPSVPPVSSVCLLHIIPAR